MVQYGDAVTVTERLDKGTFEQRCAEIVSLRLASLAWKDTMIANSILLQHHRIASSHHTLSENPRAQLLELFIDQWGEEWKRSCATIAKDGIVAPHIWHLSPSSFFSPSLSHASSPTELSCVDGRASSDPRPECCGGR